MNKGHQLRRYTATVRSCHLYSNHHLLHQRSAYLQWLRDVRMVACIPAQDRIALEQRPVKQTKKETFPEWALNSVDMCTVRFFYLPDRLAEAKNHLEDL